MLKQVQHDKDWIVTSGLRPSGVVAWLKFSMSFFRGNDILLLLSSHATTPVDDDSTISLTITLEKQPMLIPTMLL
nr:hypothetical protein [Rickettsia endosymbiont of Ceutorhynchus assimilis]